MSRETLAAAGADAMRDALDRAVCMGDTRHHDPHPVWGDRPEPPDDFDSWVEYASARVLDALLAHPEELVAAMEEAGVLEQVGWYWLENGVRDLVYDYEFTATEAKLERYAPVFRVSSRLPTEAE